jgi:iron complex outermembrane receptor protein
MNHRRRSSTPTGRIAPLALLLWCLGPPTAGAAEREDLTQLSIEELMAVQVVSVARQAQPLLDAATAVFVITAEDIRRSGATSIPEALRLAPGIQVARIHANQWAVTARGFNGRFANKLLVLIDGRTVYTPTFSGVYWEVQDMLLEDIDRIEVIRGPGAALWGANAVNGVINILTKSAADTQGGLVSLTGGDEEHAIAGLRYGGKLGEHGHYRVFGKYLQRDGLVDREGEDAGDEWEQGRAGFRLDWEPSPRDAFTVQGDLYDGDLDQNLNKPAFIVPLGRDQPPLTVLEQDAIEVSGGHLQASWQHQRSADSRMKLQMYYQREKREETVVTEKRDTVDVDFQHSFTVGEEKNRQITWGLGYRHTRDDFTTTELSAVSPTSRGLNLFSLFAQDQINLLDGQSELTLGSKLEHNDYTGWEFQPSVRGLWKPHPNQRLWAAVSRAVRTPSRGERDGVLNLLALPPSPLSNNLPVLVTFNGSEDFDAENVIAYELGYRVWFTDRLLLDATAFYNHYDDLRLRQPGAAFPDFSGEVPVLNQTVGLSNAGRGNIHGLELAADWRPTQQWRLQLAYGYMRSRFEARLAGNNIEEDDMLVPRHVLSLRSSWDPGNNLELDGWLRYMDDITVLETASVSGDAPRIDAYWSLDVRLGWRPYPDLELSLVGTNLLDDEHLEFIAESYAFPTQVQRSLYGQIKWSF